MVISAWQRNLLVGALFATAALCVRAQGDPDTADPPMRAGRIAWIEGAVSLRPAGLPDWNAAPLNQPLTTGDAIWSDTGARSELDLGQARVRLDERSSVALLELSDRAVQLRLDAGAIDVSVSDVADLDAFEIDAPSAAVSLLRPGEYRLTVDNAGSTSISVRTGQAQVQGGEQPSINLSTGQRGLFGAGGSYALTQAGPPDDFDLWCQQRQARWAQEQAATQQYVSSDVVGYEDLDDYGQWQSEPDYGYVWFPAQVPAYWVPYSAGHWVWIRPWGWSWVDEAPWGFAPFHYGRWCHIGHRWGWVPAPPHQRAVYAPALVAWIGGPGSGGATALGGGLAVGWLPLAPGEVFVPGYRTSPRYLQNVNMSNSRQLNPGVIANFAANPTQPYRYINREVPGAITAVPQVSFTAGQSTARHRINAATTWQSATPVARAPTIAPERQSMLGALTLDHVATPPAAVLDRNIVTHRMPPQSAASAGLARSTASPLAAAPPLPSAPPLPRAPPPPPGTGPNVFQQRDREIEQERLTQLREQQTQQRIQPQPHFQSLEQQRLQEQERTQDQQRIIEPLRAPTAPVQAAPPLPKAPPPPQGAPRGSPSVRPIPERTPPSPNSQR